MKRCEKLEIAKEIARNFISENGTCWYWIDLYRDVVTFEHGNCKIEIDIK